MLALIFAATMGLLSLFWSHMTQTVNTDSLESKDSFLTKLEISAHPDSVPPEANLFFILFKNCLNNHGLYLYILLKNQLINESCIKSLYTLSTWFTPSCLVLSAHLNSSPCHTSSLSFLPITSLWLV